MSKNRHLNDSEKILILLRFRPLPCIYISQGSMDKNPQKSKFNPHNIFGDTVTPAAERSDFSARTFFRSVQQWGSLSHIFSLIVLVLILVVILPENPTEQNSIMQNLEQTSQRQMLLEAMDKIVRFEHYYRDVNGRFTRDLGRLNLPDKLSTGDFVQLRTAYEIVVLTAGDSRLTVVATGVEDKSTIGDKITIDERSRISANFPLPEPNKKYLLEEAGRLLELYVKGSGRVAGLYKDYWRLENSEFGETSKWKLVGAKGPVVGEKVRLEYVSQDEGNDKRSPASLFNKVGNVLRARMIREGEDPSRRVDFDLTPQAMGQQEIRRWLHSIFLAQHMYKSERGDFAYDWEDLEKVSKINRSSRLLASVKLNPIEKHINGYRVNVDGLKGDLLGEQFVLDESGQVKQMRYTDAIKSHLSEAASFLSGAQQFQVTELKGEGIPVLDSMKSGPVELDSRGKESLPRR